VLPFGVVNDDDDDDDDSQEWLAPSKLTLYPPKNKQTPF